MSGGANRLGANWRGGNILAQLRLDLVPASWWPPKEALDDQFAEHRGSEAAHTLLEAGMVAIKAKGYQGTARRELRGCSSSSSSERVGHDTVAGIRRVDLRSARPVALDEQQAVPSLERVKHVGHTHAQR